MVRCCEVRRAARTGGFRATVAESNLSCSNTGTLSHTFTKHPSSGDRAVPSVLPSLLMWHTHSDNLPRVGKWWGQWRGYHNLPATPHQHLLLGSCTHIYGFPTCLVFIFFYPAVIITTYLIQGWKDGAYILSQVKMWGEDLYGLHSCNSFTTESLWL